ncbi:4,5-dihydroxyphthalate decarboxylase [Actinomycetales bacterium JB111]|nr:4,5-dihydroxyphthalate decarboxylase [Actinomycetales bacterium JB111]
MSSNLPLTLACARYDRTEALRRGDVAARGIDLTYLELPVEETFYRMVRFREFDVAELSLSTYVMTLDAEEPPFVAIPVFPSRAFRHSGIYVRRDSAITSPSDLRGNVVGVPEYQVTAAVWIRGILEELHDLPVSSVSYRTGGLHEPGRIEKVEFDLPTDVSVTQIAPNETLSGMLINGEIDAIYSPRTPAEAMYGDGKIVRLFSDYRATEQDYFRRTRIFPIMHVVAIRRDVYERNPWIARELSVAFYAAKAWAEEGLSETASLRYTLPWLHAEVEATRELMGEDYWRYGLAPEDPTLATFLTYSHAQGLSKHLRDERDLFAPEVLDTFRI